MTAPLSVSRAIRQRLVGLDATDDRLIEAASLVRAGQSLPDALAAVGLSYRDYSRRAGGTGHGAIARALAKGRIVRLCVVCDQPRDASADHLCDGCRALARVAWRELFGLVVR